MNIRQILFFTAKKCCRRKLHTDQVAKNTKCVFSGIQPTGSVHLGNYLGAINQWKTFANGDNKIILSIVDLHSITLPQDPDKLFDNVLEMAATLIACGLDSKKCILFQQSQIPQHTELCWQLGCLTTMARLAHLPQYKNKSSLLKDVPLGLFIYPVLQAADILAYKATDVPIGEDQVQHLQLTQELARMFNKRYGQTFPVPRAILGDDSVCRLKSLRDVSKKMSKSDIDSKSRINILDSPDLIISKLKKAVTDCTSQVFYDPVERPSVSNLINIHCAVTGKSIAEVCEEAKDIDTGKYKLMVADAVISHLEPIREEIIKLLSSPNYLLNVLNDGAKQAQVIAERTSKEVRANLGLTYKQSLIKQRQHIL